MGSPKDLNDPQVYVEALVRAVLEDRLQLAAWLAEDDDVQQHPFLKWYLYFADRLQEMAPRPEMGFQVRAKQVTPLPKIGRNDDCPCGSGKKFKQCHLDREESVAWRLGSPTPEIRMMATAQLIHRLPPAVLDRVPLNNASVMVRTEMASVYYEHHQLEKAIALLKGALDETRDDPYMLYDYWVARYAEWLVDAGHTRDAENFLLEEYDNKQSGVQPWQIAQKLTAFYIDQGETDSAITWVDVALQGDPENPFNHYLHGLLLHLMENWDGAAAAYQRAKELSDRFREQEKAYMTQLVDDALDRAQKHLPVDEEEEETEEDEEDGELSSEEEQEERSPVVGG